MQRIINAVDKSVVTVPQIPVVVGDSVTKIVLIDVTIQKGEYAGRFIQNVGANDAYYAIGSDASPANFNGMLGKAGTVNANGHGSGQQFDASNCGQQVTVYSIGGTTIAVTLQKRNDNAQGQLNVAPAQ